MPPAGPIKPARISGCNTTMTINTKEWSKDAAGAAVPSTVATVSDVPVRLDTLSPGQAFRMGHMADSTLYRLRAPMKALNGVLITLKHSQTVTIGGVDYTLIGNGFPQGRSGVQMATLQKEAV